MCRAFLFLALVPLAACGGGTNPPTSNDLSPANEVHFDSAACSPVDLGGVSGTDAHIACICVSDGGSTWSARATQVSLAADTVVLIAGEPPVSGSLVAVSPVDGSISWCLIGNDDFDDTAVVGQRVYAVANSTVVASTDPDEQGPSRLSVGSCEVRLVR